MGLLSATKLDWLQRGSLSSMVWIYEETFTLVAKMTTVRTLIAVPSVHQWYISHMNVKNAFLNGDLHEEVYMVPPHYARFNFCRHFLLPSHSYVMINDHLPTHKLPFTNT